MAFCVAITGYTFDLARNIPRNIHRGAKGFDPDQTFTASAFCLCLATRCGRVVECHLPHAGMSAGCHFPLPRPPTEAGLLHATPQLLFPASTPQALSVSELRKRSSCKPLPWTKQRFRIAGVRYCQSGSRSLSSVLNLRWRFFRFRFATQQVDQQENSRAVQAAPLASPIGSRCYTA